MLPEGVPDPHGHAVPVGAGGHVWAWPRSLAVRRRAVCCSTLRRRPWQRHEVGAQQSCAASSCPLSRALAQSAVQSARSALQAAMRPRVPQELEQACLGLPKHAMQAAQIHFRESACWHHLRQLLRLQEQLVTWAVAQLLLERNSAQRQHEPRAALCAPAPPPHHHCRSQNWNQCRSPPGHRPLAWLRVACLRGGLPKRSPFPAAGARVTSAQITAALNRQSLQRHEGSFIRTGHARRGRSKFVSACRLTLREAETGKALPETSRRSAC